MKGIIPNIKTHLVPISKSKRPGTKGKKGSITIHNTANPKSTAQNERDWLVNPSNTRTASWHYAVDDKQAVLAIPEDEVAWHAGHAEGNKSSIGIEVCESGDQVKTWKHAVGLTAKILHENGWGVDKVRTHKSWSGKQCPRLILPRWNEFIKDVEETLKSLKGQGQNPGSPAKQDLSVVDIKMSFDGGPAEKFEGVFVDGRNFVGARQILERLGFKVGWDNKTQVILVDKQKS